MLGRCFLCLSLLYQVCSCKSSPRVYDPYFYEFIDSKLKLPDSLRYPYIIDTMFYSQFKNNPPAAYEVADNTLSKSYVREETRVEEFYKKFARGEIDRVPMNLNPTIPAEVLPSPEAELTAEHTDFSSKVFNDPLDLVQSMNDNADKFNKSKSMLRDLDRKANSDTV